MRAILIALALLAGSPLHAAEVEKIRIGQQFGLFYLPLVVAKEQRLIEQAAVKLGLPEPEVDFTRLASGAPLNDALISGTLDLAAAGTSPAITIWAKTRRNLQVQALAALGEVPFDLNSNNPAVHGVGDFSPRDRIALPAVSVSMQAVVLQMAAAAAFGPAEWKRLDSLTVSLAHPDALVALTSGRSEITAHFGNPPFQEQELQQPGIHLVLSSYDVLGGPHTSSLLYLTRRFHDANPRTMQAIISALEQADAFIAAHPRDAAAMYLKVEPSALGLDATEALLRDPAMRFTTTPRRVTAFASFQARIGQIAQAPADWRQLFFPELHDRPGS